MLAPVTPLKGRSDDAKTIAVALSETRWWKEGVNDLNNNEPGVYPDSTKDKGDERLHLNISVLVIRSIQFNRYLSAGPAPPDLNLAETLRRSSQSGLAAPWRVVQIECR
jgi:hypothetical protein